MAQFAIFLAADENAWEKLTPEERQKTYDLHDAFSEQLIARGHEITGGAELEHSKNAHVIRRDGDRHVVTQGPYTESVEQISGFYLVSTENEDDLFELCAMMADIEGGVEIRRMLDEPEP